MRGALLLAAALLLPSLGVLASPHEAREHARVPVIVQFAGPPAEAARAMLGFHADAVLLQAIAGAVCHLDAAERAWVEAQPWVARVEPVVPLERHLDLSKRLIRAGAPVEELGYHGDGVTIAVLDSGIDATHPDFQGKVLANLGFVGGAWVPVAGDLDGHGTHVAGIVAGTGAASGGVLAGVAPGADLVGLDLSASFTTATALEAFDWVLQNKDAYRIRVVVNSWGRAGNVQAWDPADSISRAADRLTDEGLVLVFSAGNRGPGPGTVSFEGLNPRVITVGAVDDAATPMPFSGRGPVLDRAGQPVPWTKPDVVAPGVGVRSTRSAQAVTPGAGPPELVPSQLPLLGGGAGISPEALRYVDLTGTSQAAPHVAGVAALMLQANPSLTPAAVHDLLRASAIDVGARGPDDVTGWGLVDARDAVRRALGQAEDHGNILLAGGEEAYDARGHVAGLVGQVVQTEPALDMKEGGSVEATFPVKPGAQSLRFRFAWSPPTAVFRVYLDGPGGTAGPWSASVLAGGERATTGELQNPRPGMYRLRATPVGTVTATYEAHVAVTLEPDALPPSGELPPEQRAPQPVKGPLEQIAEEVGWEVERAARAFRRATPGAEAGLAVLGVVALALAMRRRGRDG